MPSPPATISASVSLIRFSTKLLAPPSFSVVRTVTEYPAKCNNGAQYFSKSDLAFLNKTQLNIKLVHFDE